MEIKKWFIGTITALLCVSSFASSVPLRVRFVKGNIADKTAAVKESSGEDAAFLSLAAIDFALEYKALLGNDRDLDALALSGITALSADSLASLDYGGREAVSEKLVKLFSLFSSDTVRIAVLNKTTALRDLLPPEPCINLLHDYLADTPGSGDENAVVKAAVKALSEIGDSRSFALLFSCRKEQKWPNCTQEIDDALALLADKSFPQIVDIIREGNVKSDIRPLFDLFIKNKEYKVVAKDGSEKTYTVCITIEYAMPTVAPADTETVKKFYGSYPGKLHFDNNDYAICVVCDQEKLISYSQAMSAVYTNMQWTKGSTTEWICKTYSKEDFKRKNVKNTLTFRVGTDGKITCKLVVNAMGDAPSNEMEKGADYIWTADDGKGFKAPSES